MISKISLKTVATHIFIFSSINDNFMVDLFGGAILKISFALFLLVNIDIILKTSAILIKRYVFFFAFFSIALLSFVLNLPTYVDILTPSFQLVTILSIFCVISQDKNPNSIMTIFILSSVFSSFLCLISPDSIYEWAFRKSGGTGDPNEYSLTVLIPLMYIVGRIFSANTKQVLHILPIACLFVSGLFYAGSKAAFLSLAIVIFVLIILLFKKYPFHKSFLLLLFFLFVFVLISKFLLSVDSEVVRFLFARFADNESMHERLISWRYGMELFVRKPFFGIGPENYFNIISKLHPEINGTPLAVHNIFMQVLAEMGFLGLFSFIFFSFRPFSLFIKRQIPIEYAMGYFVLMLMSCTLPVLYDKYLWLYFALLYNNNIKPIKIISTVTRSTD